MSYTPDGSTEEVWTKTAKAHNAIVILRHKALKDIGALESSLASGEYSPSRALETIRSLRETLDHLDSRIPALTLHSAEREPVTLPEFYPERLPAKYGFLLDAPDCGNGVDCLMAAGAMAYGAYRDMLDLHRATARSVQVAIEMTTGTPGYLPKHALDTIRKAKSILDVTSGDCLYRIRVKIEEIGAAQNRLA